MQKLTSSALRGTGKFATVLYFTTSNFLCWIFPPMSTPILMRNRKEKKKDYAFSFHCILILCYLNETVNKTNQYHGVTIKVVSILYKDIAYLFFDSASNCVWSTSPSVALKMASRFSSRTFLLCLTCFRTSPASSNMDVGGWMLFRMLGLFKGAALTAIPSTGSGGCERGGKIERYWMHLNDCVCFEGKNKLPLKESRSRE